jgi:hypothetical protein
MDSDSCALAILPGLQVLCPQKYIAERQPIPSRPTSGPVSVATQRAGQSRPPLQPELSRLRDGGLALWLFLEFNASESEFVDPRVLLAIIP